MARVLLPVDGSDNALRAVRHVADRFTSGHALEAHLLHVRRPFSRHIARFVSWRNRASYHREQAERSLERARVLLRQAGVPFTEHVELGERAETITRVAKEIGASEIVMGTARKHSFTRLVEDSVSYRVLELAHAPVEIVAGPSVTPLERFGVPAGVAAALALVLIAAVD
ncbi:MAG: universal stress protein [Burkholderiales bacterium]